MPVHDTCELKVGDLVPEFVFQDTAKKKVSLKQFEGKYVVIRCVGILVLSLQARVSGFARVC